MQVAVDCFALEIVILNIPQGLFLILARRFVCVSICVSVCLSVYAISVFLQISRMYVWDDMYRHLAGDLVLI